MPAGRLWAYCRISTERAGRFCWSPMMTPSQATPLESFYSATERSFPIACFLRAGFNPLPEVRYEERQAHRISYVQYASLYIMDCVDDDWHHRRYCFAGDPYFHWGSDEVRNHAALQEHDWYLRHDHDPARWRSVVRHAYSRQRAAYFAFR